ncbi:uncharacterized protein T551_00963 [Pneumocystis jirovecii RU7]|uniref:Seipin n=1 Tax=Pneumocystis jirovecii (strain RU7) TaxID=1408657 RepID=A0A0W4ZTK8_PNEJ7|nr:uncharacterized protein T551_00963 [Pneumocystis jirovecii RU7]KTW31702.1 hypothetical protein T551_00963 [Pneumocystis jirovecii RU7]
MQISYPIYLQYGNEPLWASVDFSFEKRFVNEQFYNIFLELLIPQSELNFNIGNFMVNIKLFSELGVLMTSSRPAILTFSSLLLTKLRTLVMLPMLLLGFLREEERLVIPLIEGFKYHKAHETMLKSVNITFSDNIQVYSSKLIFSAQLQGIRYLVYYHRIFSFILFTTLFWIFEWIIVIILYFIGRKLFNVPLSQGSSKKSTCFHERFEFSKKNNILLKKNDSLKDEESGLEDSPLLPLDFSTSMSKIMLDKPMDESCESFLLDDGKNGLDEKIG